MLLCPAPLKVILGGTMYFFDIPEDVWQWLKMWDEEPKERLSAWRTGLREWALRVSIDRGIGDIPETITQQAPVGIEDGRVEIQADGTMALAALDQSYAVNAPTSMSEEMTIQKENEADENLL
ncbi:hypothetical protein NDU88_002847 [Pleurodeles waltl]|uniref:Uncharacterized protein n=1 Tax=Pleurodeles waltl TaxID=8319 RepID=A0AAV7QE17_PLEWA|nr:hypothetical protein NDU88_002847 [Pleurodeles waltl]